MTGFLQGKYSDSITELKSDEILLRIDAVFTGVSDCKTFGLSLTAVEIGSNLMDKVAVGARFDTLVRNLPANSRYCVLNESKIDGLSSIPADSGYAEAAIGAFLSGLLSDYRKYRRDSLKTDGFALFVGPAKNDRYELPEASPRKAVLAGVGDSIDKSALGDAEIIEINPIVGPELKALAQERTGARGFDDIIVLGRVEPELIGKLQERLSSGGVLNLVSDQSTDISKLDSCKNIFEVIGTDVADGYNKLWDGKIMLDGTGHTVSAIESGKVSVHEFVRTVGSSSDLLTRPMSLVYPFANVGELSVDGWSKEAEVELLRDCLDS